jgi:hypothetical protein
LGTVVEDILANRQGKHGEFNENSTVTWQIMRILMAQRNWPILTDGQRHALYMDAHKMARIIVGDPNEVDHWDDIAGYATLVADRIRKDVVAYNTDTDIYGALAVGWGIPRSAAADRYQQIANKNRRQYEEDQRRADLQQNKTEADLDAETEAALQAIANQGS